MAAVRVHDHRERSVPVALEGVGIHMIVLPLAGLLSLIWLIGMYSIFFGALLLAMSLRRGARWRTEIAHAQ